MKQYFIYIPLLLGLLITINTQTEQSKASACAEYAATRTGELGIELSAKALELLANIIEKGINIRKFHFSGSLAGIEEGVLPHVEISGVIAGQEFKIAVNVTDQDLKAPTRLVSKIVDKIKSEDTISGELVPVDTDIKEQ